jgi:L-amino acid N-acyltransferase YncA
MEELITVRPVEPADLGEVREIFGWYAVNSLTTFEEAPRSTAEWDDLRTQLARLNLPFLVACEGDEVRGYAYAAPWRRKAAYRHTVENSVFIAPGQTGRGLGRLLLTELIAASPPAGARQMIAVIADTGDPASPRLHAACGFTLAGRLSAVGFKHGRWLDTVLMQRAL